MIGEGQPQEVFNFFKSINIIRYYAIALSCDDYKVLVDALENLNYILKLGISFKNSSSMNPFVVDLMNLGVVPRLE